MKEIIKKIYEGEVHTNTYSGEYIKHAGTHTTSALLYGEMTEIGMNVMISRLRKDNLFDGIHFLDLGSGNGRSVLHMGLMEEVITSTGIEVFESKSDYANTLLKSINYPYTEKISLINEDWDEVKDYRKYNLVLLNNADTLHHPPFSVLKRLKRGTIILCVFDIKNSYILNLEKLESIDSYYSWTKNSLPMTVYRVL
jgi:hypothetical protein